MSGPERPAGHAGDPETLHVASAVEREPGGAWVPLVVFTWGPVRVELDPGLAIDEAAAALAAAERADHQAAAAALLRRAGDPSDADVASLLVDLRGAVDEPEAVVCTYTAGVSAFTGEGFVHVRAEREGERMAGQLDVPTLRGHALKLQTAAFAAWGDAAVVETLVARGLEVGLAGKLLHVLGDHRAAWSPG